MPPGRVVFDFQRITVSISLSRFHNIDDRDPRVRPGHHVCLHSLGTSPKTNGTREIVESDHDCTPLTRKEFPSGNDNAKCLG
jgi:hypothetical protein